MYELVKDAISHEFCDYIRNTYKQNGQLNKRAKWAKGNAYTQFNDDYTKVIIHQFSDYIPKDYIHNWIAIACYETGDNLGLHGDNYSLRTIMCDISEYYEGGNFMIRSNHSIQTNKGDVILLNGYEVKHGVDYITKGTRYSLNIWSRPKEESKI